MIEYRGADGGRYTYIDDFLNLQELALSYSAILSDCANCIVSGCLISSDNSKITQGYVYINGKLRFLPETSLTNTNYPSSPFYIVEQNEGSNTAYVDGTSKLGRYNYSCQITTTRPIGSFGFVEVRSSGTSRLKDAFFGKYSLIKDPSAASQTVAGKVIFEDDTEAKSVTAEILRLSKNNKDLTFTISDTSYQILSSSFKAGLGFESGNGFLFTNNGNSLASLSLAGKFKCQDVEVNKGAFGDITITNSGIYEHGTNSNAPLYINMLGYNGNNTHFRDLVIGNGKNSQVFKVDGVNSEVISYGALSSEHANSSGLVLKHNGKAISDTSFQKIISWADSGGSVVAHIGYDSVSDNVFRIKNDNNRGIEVVGGYFDTKCEIRENGAPLSNKYVLKATYDDAIALKADASTVYTTQQTDETFVKVENGLTQITQSLVASGETEAEAKKAIRDQIDACSLKSDIDPVFLRRDGTYNNNKTLTLDEQKTLANNLGVLHSESAQGKLVDTGWKQIRTGNGNDLYARQFGPVVCIQGMLKVEANGFEYNYSAFGIEAPKYKVEFVTVNLGTNNTDGVSLTIDSGECIIKVNNQHKFSGLVVSVSFTYMV